MPEAAPNDSLAQLVCEPHSFTAFPVLVIGSSERIQWTKGAARKRGLEQAAATDKNTLEETAATTQPT